MSKNITLSKQYPRDYPSDAIAILDAMSMDNSITLVGSMSLRSQQYAGDYDGFEKVEKKGKLSSVLQQLRKRFQSNIKKLRAMENVYIGDIKAGVVEQWRVIPRTAEVVKGKIVGYNSTACKKRLDDLLKSNIITHSEYTESEKLLKDKPSIGEFLQAKNNIKYQVIRWNVAEVLNNKKYLRNGKPITLEESFNTHGITKLDVIGLIQNYRFTDFSVIYEFHCNGKVLNPEPINIQNSLRESIIAYKSEGNYFKALKRLFALSKLNHNEPLLKELNEVLNSDLGRLYIVVGDMDTLLTLFDEHQNIPYTKIRYEIDQFIQRLSTVYTIGSYLKKDDAIIKEIRNISSRLPDNQIRPALEKVRNELYEVLQKESAPYFKNALHKVR